MSAKSVRVICRFRYEKPFDNEGKDQPFDPDWEYYPEENTIKRKDKTFVYDAVLAPDTTQEAAYEKIGRESISDYMIGYNTTIFAYGQSGSGKTFSMVGPDEINDQLALDFSKIPENIQQLFGIVPRATVQMFETINQNVSEGAEYTVSCSYVEIYMEEITCLLSLKDRLKIKEYPDGSVEVDGKQKNLCKTPEDIFKVIALGTKNKTTGGTAQNARSSRSHTMLVVETESKSLEGQKKKSKLNLIDLAGSEKQRNTGATGERAKEAIKINLSLTSLNMVFMALTTEGEKKYIPFKDSKLTRLLKDSLGGNSLTTLLCTASRKVRYVEDTVGTLGFAQRAKKIKNDVKQNVEMGVKEYKYLCDALKGEVLVLRGDLKKSNLPIHIVTDKLVLSYLPNDMIGAGSDEAGAEGQTGEITTSSETSNTNSVSRGDLKIRKRHSLLNLNEEEFVMKYCELKAKYDNLLESASNKIHELNEEKFTKLEEQNVAIEISRKEDKELIAKYEQVLEEKNKVIYDLENKLKENDKELKDQKEFIELNAEDVINLNNKVSDLETEKEENQKLSDAQEKKIKRLEEDLSRYTVKVDDLFNKVKEGEQANEVYNFKIEELERQVSVLKEDKNVNEGLEIKISELEKEKLELSKRISELEKALEKSQQELKEKDYHIQSKTDAVEMLKQDADLKLKQLEKEHKDDNLATIEKVRADCDLRVNKLMKEISSLQVTVNKLTSDKSSLEIQLLETKRKMETLDKSSSTIRTQVSIDQKSNIFGGLLKKTGEGNKFLKEAQKEAKHTEQVLNEVWKDKIEDLKKLRENIIRMSPQTCSSRSVPDEEYQNIDFDDEVAFKKMQEKLMDREERLAHEKEKINQMREDLKNKKKD